MKTYSVVANVNVEYIVKANNEEQAEEKARELELDNGIEQVDVWEVVNIQEE